MAVIDGLPETKVSIRVNGSEEDCIEYDDPDPPKSASSQGPATHTTSKVIESQVDAGFSIRFESRNRRTWINGKNWLALQLHIDGQFIATYHCGPSALVDQTIVSTIDSFPERSSKPGKEIRRHFNFASIKTVEGSNEQLSRDQVIAKHLGIIEVTVFRVKLDGRKLRIPSQLKKENIGDISEMALKGKSISHSTSFTEGTTKDARKWVKKFKNRDGSQQIARFFFRYKPKASLQIDGIIPRDPSPDPSPEPSPPPPLQTVADLPLADIMRLAQERLEQLEPQVKREPGTGVKREADEETDSRPRKIYKIDADGTIDLSDD
ncbi:hypothetical protein HER10_EVM0009979 [Colletotrichum scovillei]|uniref:DUF7918 domain-containing protein n=1 Tax=Colletotrichum scovillei TaxID=1209932 RepID=A0A9P7UI33_9PEZI|nr:uncharacterized protein HER10_EVM0009979 [Colletotrichum scovillei]KAF4776922.1 hypothetical protein HER10_EVM0009979 [Colletotrichum scovillei]KAG7054157.1 hypothetical protein JMJ77_0001227 [Colletotrichum scovillei]KAG7072454.1 hypothetical protein JMJ76_0005304 [Colletotrichum scovillei]KAG7080643.1 hypothetical protein JMJ78_0007729 [Colletotrichum scovillei]